MFSHSSWMHYDVYNNNTKLYVDTLYREESLSTGVYSGSG